MGFNEKMAALADAIRAKANITGKLSITGMTEAVENITVGGGCDITPGSVVINKNKVNVLAGYVDSQTLTIPSGSVSREGIYIKVKEGYVETAEIVLPVVEPSLTGNLFTVGEGYVEEDYTLTVPEASITETETEITVGVGYVSTQKVFEKSSTPELPDVTFTATDLLVDKTAIDSDGNVVTGAMPYSKKRLIEGGFHVNYTAGYLENDIDESAPSATIIETEKTIEIKPGWVETPLRLDKPSTNIYKCTLVNETNKTWSGLIGNFSGENGYKSLIFSSTEEIDKPIELIAPKIGFFYNYDATIEYNYISVNAKYNDNYVFRTFESDAGDATVAGGGKFGIEADSSYLDEENESENSKTPSQELPCLDSQTNPTLYRVEQNFDSNSFTVMFWAKVFYQGNSNSLTGVAFGVNGQEAIVVQVINSGNSGFSVLEEFESTDLLNLDYPSFAENTQGLNPNQTQVTSLDTRYWNHYAFVYDARTKKCNTYINGVQGREYTNNGIFDFIPHDVYYGVATTSRMSGLIISKSALSKELIQWMAWKSPEETTAITRVYPQIILEKEEVEYNIIVGSEDWFYIGYGGKCWWNSEAIGQIRINVEEHPSWIEVIPEYLSDEASSGSFFSGTPTIAGEYEIKGYLSPENYENCLVGTFYENYQVANVPFKIKINVDDGLLYIKISSIAGGGYVRINGNEIIASGIFGGGEEPDDYAYAELTNNGIGIGITKPLQDGVNVIDTTISEIKDFEIISGEKDLIVYNESSQQVSFLVSSEADITEHSHVELRFKYRL